MKATRSRQETKISNIVKNSKDLVTPENFKLKVLVYALPGTGKTEWASTAPDPGFAACETGQGNGLLTVAQKGVDYCTPENLREFEAVCKGEVFKDKKTLVLDSLSSMETTFIKDAVLAIPRQRGDSEKRKGGVPELDDYQLMAEITRKLLNKLLHNDQHLIVTATEKYKGPDVETGQGESLFGPDLPGQMFTGSTGMFDFVFRMRTRQKLRNPNDAKSKYIERYFITGPDGQGTIAKCRSSISGKPLLDREEVFDSATGVGSFQYLLDKILKGYSDNATQTK